MTVFYKTLYIIQYLSLIEGNSGGFDNSSRGECDFEFPIILFVTNNLPECTWDIFFFQIFHRSPLYHPLQNHRCKSTRK